MIHPFTQGTAVTGNCGNFYHGSGNTVMSCFYITLVTYDLVFLVYLVPQVGTGVMTTVVAIASDIGKPNSEMQFNVSFTQ